MSQSTPPDAFAGHDAGRWAPVPVEIVAQWPEGHFAENLAIDASGQVFVSLHSESRIDRYDPASGTVSRFVDLPAPVAGLAFGGDGALWATGGVLGQVPGLIWRIDPNGRVEQWAEIHDAVFLNGATPHPDGRTLLVAESMTGRVIAIDQTQKNRWWAWLAHDLLRPTGQRVPGANGVKILDGFTYISVTDRNTLFRAPINDDGSAGEIAQHAADIRADDMAFDVNGNLYIATHPANSVLRLSPDGMRVTIAGPAEGAVGATACAFGRAPADLNALYVTTTGGAWAPYKGVVQPAKLLRLDVGARGKDLLS